jgi:1,4-alpha-glucan branching enzyme
VDELIFDGVTTNQKLKMTTELSNDKSARQITTPFVFPAAAARRVSLAGDFNDWDLEDMPMYKASDGVWYLSVSLTPGRHEYRFIADGVRQGNENSVKIVNAGIIRAANETKFGSPVNKRG